uniref:Uncharacterized protein n=1 Tax=Anguilla anguilla TaxID=7936 RepID=A0A0E9PE08_ANGAN
MHDLSQRLRSKMLIFNVNNSTFYFKYPGRVGYSPHKGR